MQKVYNNIDIIFLTIFYFNASNILFIWRVERAILTLFVTWYVGESFGVNWQVKLRVNPKLNGPI